MDLKVLVFVLPKCEVVGLLGDSLSLSSGLCILCLGLSALRVRRLIFQYRWSAGFVCIVSGSRVHGVVEVSVGLVFRAQGSSLGGLGGLAGYINTSVCRGELGIVFRGRCSQ